MRSIALGTTALLLLTGCGESAVPAKEKAVEEAKQFIDETKVADLLTAEAKFALGAFEQDVRAQIAAYKTEFGALPTSFAELKSMAAPTALATTAVTDALAEQLPFVRRETLEQISARFVAATEKRIFEQVVAQDAVPGAEGSAR
jgi:hypothetical protein